MTWSLTDLLGLIGGASIGVAGLIAVVRGRIAVGIKHDPRVWTLTGVRARVLGLAAIAAGAAVACGPASRVLQCMDGGGYPDSEAGCLEWFPMAVLW